MRKLIPVVLLSIFTCSSYGVTAPENIQYTQGERQFYSITAEIFPQNQKNSIIDCMNSLKKLNEIVYVRENNMNPERIVHVNVGLFEGRDQLGEVQAKLKNIDSAVNKVDSVTAYSIDLPENNIAVVPTGIWFYNDNFAKEIYDYSTSDYQKFQILVMLNPYDDSADLSADGSQLLLFSAFKVFNIDTNTGEIIFEIGRNEKFNLEMYRSEPTWSPSGKHAAFIDQRAWEHSANLYIIRPDGSDMIMIAEGKSQNTIKDYVWHPWMDRLFFIRGYAMGTIQADGTLYSVDLDGNEKEVKHKTIELPISLREIEVIDESTIFLKSIHFTDDYISAEIKEHTLRIEDLIY